MRISVIAEKEHETQELPRSRQILALAMNLEKVACDLEKVNHSSNLSLLIHKIKVR